MTATQILVGMGEIQVVQGEASFVCIGLGSSIAVCLADMEKKVGGLAHIMLPTTLDGGGQSRPAKFADSAIPTLIEMIERLGGRKEELVAALVGGAKVIHGKSSIAALDFGGRNVAAAEKALAEQEIKIVAAETGGKSGRTVTFDLGKGIVVVRTPTTPDTFLCRFNGEEE